MGLISATGVLVMNLLMMCRIFTNHIIPFPAPAAVPPLVVSLINGSPLVRNDSVEVDISLSRPVQSLVCTLRGDSDTIEKDCESTTLSNDTYSITIYTRHIHKIYNSIQWNLHYKHYSIMEPTISPL